MNYQGGKAFGELKDSQFKSLEEINEQFRTSGKYDDVEELDEKLAKYQRQFMEFDENNSGDIDMMELKRMMEKLGQAKTHLELKKMIAEVDTNGSGTINYDEFLTMMLGKKSSILKLILMFEEKNKEKEIPKGLPPKRTLDSLP
ncbi:allograft inflammatory factor 1-like [Dysidea avara]|uniref:allograft inflammatory factor 1-like n=1 Tax=Dysidea avara TaxID=196820 RepID=UPI0033339535